jgi:DNA-directed RNA polymerase specialized sigma24 family protein
VTVDESNRRLEGRLGHDWLAEQFEANRTHLRAVAYRMLGSLSEADDAVQESWIHLSRSGTSGVENLGGWLTTVVARVCLDMLRSRRSRREEPLLETYAIVSCGLSLRRGGAGPTRSPGAGLTLRRGAPVG